MNAWLIGMGIYCALVAIAPDDENHLLRCIIAAVAASLISWGLNL